MSLTPKLNRAAVIAGITGLAVIGGGLAVMGGGLVAESVSNDEPRPTARLRTPSSPLELIATTTPAESAVAVSSRLYASSPAVVVSDATNPQSQALAIDTATRLVVPVLLDGASTAAELKRLGAEVVLTVGKTDSYAGGRAITTSTVSKEIARVREAYDVKPPSKREVVVVTASTAINAAAAATATNAGAMVLELPGGDPRREPEVAKALAATPTAPVIALGAPFTSDFEYTLGAVRSGVEQFGGGYLALPGRTMVALYGHPSTKSLGVLGEQGVSASIKRAHLLATKYRSVVKTPVVPTFEIIATVASAGAGKDKNYSAETKIKDLLPLIDAAEKAGVYVILDLQPGRTDFLVQAKRYESLLKRPTSVSPSTPNGVCVPSRSI